MSNETIALILAAVRKAAREEVAKVEPDLSRPLRYMVGEKGNKGDPGERGVRDPGQDGVDRGRVGVSGLPTQARDMGAKIYRMLPGPAANLQHFGGSGQHALQDRQDVRSIAFGGGGEKAAVVVHGVKRSAGRHQSGQPAILSLNAFGIEPLASSNLLFGVINAHSE